MTSKGQITVPKDVREALGLTAGTRVTFSQNADGNYVLAAAHSSLRDLRGRLSHAGSPVTLEEMDEAVVAGAQSAT